MKSENNESTFTVLRSHPTFPNQRKGGGRCYVLNYDEGSRKQSLHSG